MAASGALGVNELIYMILLSIVCYLWATMCLKDYFVDLFSRRVCIWRSLEEILQFNGIGYINLHMYI